MLIRSVIRSIVMSVFLIGFSIHGNVACANPATDLGFTIFRSIYGCPALTKAFCDPVYDQITVDPADIRVHDSDGSVDSNLYYYCGESDAVSDCTLSLDITLMDVSEMNDGDTAGNSGVCVLTVNSDLVFNYEEQQDAYGTIISTSYAINGLLLSDPTGYSLSGDCYTKGNDGVTLDLGYYGAMGTGFHADYLYSFFSVSSGLTIFEYGPAEYGDEDLNNDYIEPAIGAPLYVLDTCSQDTGAGYTVEQYSTVITHSGQLYEILGL